MRAAEIIAALGMQPHPEGGWYAETFRDNPNGGRGYSTAIYYLLERGQISAWHRVKDAAEVWHYYAGGPLALSQRGDGEAARTATLGPDILAGQRPQIIVPANVWQMAEPLGDWTLVGCTVAPGFDFASFELEAG
jgi:predicted cupin superfamily sugar epimerase